MKPAHLLVVEDDENDIFFLKRAFDRSGVTNPLCIVQSGQEAIDYLRGENTYSDRTRFPFPAMVLLDLKLPCVNGIDVLRWIRKQPDCAGLPVIVLTSSTLKTDIEEAYSSGANSYVVKPASPEVLANMMRDFANWWLRHNRFSGRD
jgi:CheY-like chemotaxis protein